MADNKKKLSEEAVLALVEQAKTDSVGWYDSRLSRERQRVINYINGALPKRSNKGVSSYVASDVFDSVSAMNAQIVETFSANPDNLISFPPLHEQDVEAAREATETCNHVFYYQNDGEGIVQSTSYDGLTARAGIVKVYWDDCKEEFEESFSGISLGEVQGLAAQPDVAELEANVDEATGTYSGTLTRQVDKSKVCIDPLAPEEFLIASRARDVPTSPHCHQRTEKSKAELLEEGYDPKKVARITWEEDKELSLSPEVIAREEPVQSAVSFNDPVQDEVAKVLLYESYVRMDLHDGKGVKLYKVCHAGGVVLSGPDEVDRAPFKVYIPLPIPHTFLGENFARRVIPTQNARTVLTRGILDHTAITTNPRWTVLKGGLLNPKEMRDNRQGGLVNITRPDAIRGLEYSNLNPFVFQTLELLKANNEQTTGISALSQGMNKDAISTQNSHALIDQLVNLSMQRQKTIARNFAKFLKEVYLEIYRLILENQDKSKQMVIQIAGQFKPVSTKDWVERNVCKVALHLGYGERDRMTQKYAGLYKSLTEDPELAPCFTLQNRFNLVVDGMKTGGFENYSRYITPPQMIKPPQPDPMKVAETKAKVDTAQAAMIKAQSGVQKNQDHAQIAALKEQIAQLKHQVDASFKAREEARKDAEVANRIQISQREMKLAEEAAPGKETDLVSPSA